MMAMAMVEMFGVPEYASEYEFVVARECDGEWWFWGAYDEHGRAVQAALEIGGRVFHQ